MFFVLNIFDRSQVLTHKAAQRVPGWWIDFTLFIWWDVEKLLVKIN